MDDDGPQPGAARHRGPKPAATVRDVAWAGLAMLVAVATAAQFLRFIVYLLGLEQRAGGGALFLGFLVTVVWLMTIWWLVMGAWRRTVWGCPFAHDAAASAGWRCSRHAMADPAAQDETGQHEHERREGPQAAE